MLVSNASSLRGVCAKGAWRMTHTSWRELNDVWRMRHTSYVIELLRGICVLDVWRMTYGVKPNLLWLFIAQPIDYLFGLPIKYPINTLYILVFPVCDACALWSRICHTSYVKGRHSQWRMTYDVWRIRHGGSSRRELAFDAWEHRCQGRSMTCVNEHPWCMCPHASNVQQKELPPWHIRHKIGRKQKWLDHVPHRDISVTIWLKHHSPSRKRLIK